MDSGLGALPNDINALKVALSAEAARAAAGDRPGVAPRAISLARVAGKGAG